MRNFINALAVALAIHILTTAASAGGPHTQDPFSWTGFYAGAYVGGAWGHSDIRTDTGTVTATSYFASQANIDSVNQNSSGPLNPDAVVGGVQIGANLQEGNWVFGLEADFGAFNLNGSRGAANAKYPVAPPSVPDTYTVRASIDTDWLATARARIGWAPQSNLLIYATGGLALTNLRVSNSFSDVSDTAGVGGGSHTQVISGWTLGGGAELTLSRAWSIKAEYLYVDFGSTTVRSSVACGPAATFPCGGSPPAVTPSPFTTSADLTAHIARLGLNYRF